MLVIDVLRLATRMFRTNRSRTLLTILGISVGIGAILFLVSLGYGMQKLILNKITSADAILSLDVSTGGMENIKIDNEIVDKIKETPNVDRVSPVITVQAQIVIDDISSEITAHFANSDFFKLDGTDIEKGDFYTDSEEDKHKVILSSSALKLFGLDENSVFNKKLKFSFFIPKNSLEIETDLNREAVAYEEEFTVVGIIKEDNSNYVYIPFATSDKLNIDDYSRVKVKVVDKDALGPVRAKIVGYGYQVSALSDIIEQANQVFGIIQIILASFGIVALIVSAIGMFNTMTIALLERTQEIGVMKALGATSLDIWNMFLAESVIIGFLGGTGGIVIGMLGGKIFNFFLNFLAGFYEGDKINLFSTPVWFVLLIISFSTLVGFVTGFYPARRAARINALEALRYK